MSLRVLLKDLAPGQTYAVQFRSYNGDGYSDWSQIFRFDTTADTIAPADVTGLTWNVTGGSFVGNWNKVVLDENGGFLSDFRDYVVTISDGLSNKLYYQTSESFAFPPDVNQQVFGSIRSTITITVQARDYTGNLSNPVSLTATDPLPPIPTAPGVTVYLGNLVVAWDGKQVGGLNMPYNFDNVEIHVSTTSGFTPSTTTLNQRLYDKGQVIISGLTYGTLYYVKLVAVNTLGRSSDPSAQSSGTPSRISGLDIADNQISVSQINFADQIGGPKAFYQTTAPTTGMKTNDIWYDTSASGAYQPYTYSGTAWVINNNIGVISGTKILAGTLTANAVGTNQIIANSANIANGIIDNAKISSLDAGKITTGTLQSSSTITFNGVARPAWSIDLGGIATFASANILGQLVVGNSADTAANNANFIMKSQNYLAGSTGWAIKGNGDAEFNNGTFRGTLGAVSLAGGTITGGTISGTTITGGTIGATVAINGPTITGGTIQTSSSSTNTVRMDTTGLRLYDSGGNQTVNLSTSSGVATITGLFRSNFSGQRVEINSSFTRAEGATPWVSYAAMRLFGSDGFYGEISNGAASSQYVLQMISPRATATNGSFLRLWDNDTFDLFGTTGTVTGRSGLTLSGNSGGSTGTLTLNGTTVVINGSTTFGTMNGSTMNANAIAPYTSSSINISAPSGAVFLNPTGGGYVAAANVTSGTPGISFQGNAGNGIIFIATFSDGYGTGLSVVNSTNTGYQSVRSSGFNTISDVSIKSNIAPASSLLAEVVSAQVYEYDVDASEESVDNQGQVQTIQKLGRRRGLIAGEAPGLVRVPGKADSNDELGKLDGIDLYAMAATSWGAIQELHATIEMLKQEINELKGTP
jgi:hypothetical protein